MALLRQFTSRVRLLDGVAAVASAISLVWVYQWAVTNNSFADSEHQRLIISTMLALGLIGALIVVSATLDAAAVSGALKIIRVGATGAFVAVAASAASTLLIAMAIAPATDPGDFGRPLFRVAYAGALALSLAVGLSAVWSASVDGRGSTALVVATLVMLVLTSAAWASLATGSSELNQCVVDDEFPLATDHGCSGQ